MELEILEKNIGKRIRLTCVFGNNEEVIFYTGIINSIIGKSIDFTDKFNNSVFIEADSIKKVDEVNE